MTAVFVEHAAQDICYAVHTLRRSRTFAAAVITTLALAIAANTTMLSLVEQVLVRPLPYRDAGRLFVVAEGDGSGNYRAASYQTFIDWQRQSRTLAGLAFVRGNSAILRTSSGSERAVFGAVTPGFFRILGVHAALGRTFAPDEERGLGGDVAVLSNEFWQSRFGGDRGIVGTKIDYDNASVRIIGILPPGVSSFFPPVGTWRPCGGVRQGFRDWPVHRVRLDGHRVRENRLPESHMKLGHFVAWGAATSMSVAGCKPDIVGCPASLTNAISLTVVDSMTGEAPAATSTIVATSGTYTETDTNETGNPMDNVYAIAFGRSGAFTLLARTPGYADWSAAGVRVAGNSCGPSEHVSVVAKLQH